MSTTPRTDAIFDLIGKANRPETDHGHFMALMEGARNGVEELEAELAITRSALDEIRGVSANPNYTSSEETPIYFTGVDPASETKVASTVTGNDFKDVSGARPSRERSLAITKIQEAIMWLGMDLKAIGESPNPYPESYNPESPVIEPTADGLKL